jgi:hypothetical protein
VVMTVAIGTLIAAVGLGADMAVLYLNWVRLQGAADAAVLAGASYLPGNPSQATTTAKTYATKNGIQTAEITSTSTAPDSMSISMSLSRTVPYSFLRIVGLYSGVVKVLAKAGVQQDSESTRGLIPIGLPCSPGNCTYNPGQLYKLVQAGASGSGGSWSLGPGNWARLALGDHGATQFLNNLELGYVGSINVGDSINAEQGQVNGPTDQGISDRVNLGTAMDGAVSSPTLATVPSYDPRLVAVPMVDFTGVTGNSVQVPVVGFAMLWLDSYTAKGSQKSLNAYFLGTIPVSDIPSSTLTFGMMSPILLQ